MGKPSTSSKVVRSTSCRASIASRARCRADASGVPDKVLTSWTLYKELPGCSRSKNHKRLWPKDAGTATSPACTSLTSIRAGFRPPPRQCHVPAKRAMLQADQLLPDLLFQIRGRVFRIVPPPDTRFGRIRALEGCVCGTPSCRSLNRRGHRRLERAVSRPTSACLRLSAKGAMTRGSICPVRW